MTNIEKRIRLRLVLLRLNAVRAAQRRTATLTWPYDFTAHESNDEFDLKCFVTTETNGDYLDRRYES